MSFCTQSTPANSHPPDLRLLHFAVNDRPLYPFFADAVLFLHVAIALFVVGGLIVVLIGNRHGWRWVNGLWFRLAHLAAIAIIAAQAWLGVACPLTVLETWLRMKAGAPSYSGSFIGHWLERLLYYDGPAWVFTLIYTLFGLAVAAIWWYYPPRRRRR